MPDTPVIVNNTPLVALIELQAAGLRLGWDLIAETNRLAGE